MIHSLSLMLSPVKVFTTSRNRYSPENEKYTVYFSDEHTQARYKAKASIICFFQLKHPRLSSSKFLKIASLVKFALTVFRFDKYTSNYNTLYYKAKIVLFFFFCFNWNVFVLENSALLSRVESRWKFPCSAVRNWMSKGCRSRIIITFHEHPEVIGQLKVVQHGQEEDTGRHVRLHGDLKNIYSI